jgi:hypothetical protein
MLARDPSKRQPSAAAVAAALEPFGPHAQATRASGVVTTQKLAATLVPTKTARPVVRTTLTAPVKQRSRLVRYALVLAGAAVLMIAAATGVGVGVWYSLQEPEAAQNPSSAGPVAKKTGRDLDVPPVTSANIKPGSPKAKIEPEPKIDAGPKPGSAPKRDRRPKNQEPPKGEPKAPEPIRVLLDMLHGNDNALRKKAVLGILQLGEAGRAAQDDLIETLNNKDNDEELRTAVAFALGKLGTTKAVPVLLARIVDDEERHQVRLEACTSLVAIGVCAEVRAAVPQLIEVLDNPKQPMVVRARVLWSLCIHQNGLNQYNGLLTSLTRILAEPELPAKMLRYHAAHLLCALQGPQAPQEVLPVLREYLHDDKVRLFGPMGQKVGITLYGELRPDMKGAVVQVSGEGDGRVMALIALGRLGYERTKTDAAIIAQVTKLRDGDMFHADLRKEAGKLLNQWGVTDAAAADRLAGLDRSRRGHPLPGRGARRPTGALRFGGRQRAPLGSVDRQKEVHLRLQH